MNISYIPVVGFIVDCVRMRQVQNAYFACHAKGLPCWQEYNATWPVFEQLNIAFASSGIFFLAALIAINVAGMTMIVLHRKKETSK